LPLRLLVAICSLREEKMLELFKDIWGSLSLKFLYFAAIVGMSFGMYSCGKQSGQEECMIQQVIENQKFNLYMNSYKKRLERNYDDKLKKIQNKESFDRYIQYFTFSVSNDAAIMYAKTDKSLQSSADTK
jgi:hypothetical protein